MKHISFIDGISLHEKPRSKKLKNFQISIFFKNNDTKQGFILAC